MRHVVPVGFLLLAVAVAPAAEPKPRLDADGIPLPAEALRRFGSAKFSGGPHAVAAFSPDGKTLFAAREIGNAPASVEDGISAWEVATGHRRWRSAEKEFTLAAAAATDGESVWVVTAASPYTDGPVHLRRLRTADGKPLNEQAISERRVTSVTVRADGRVALAEWEKGDQPHRVVVLDGAGKTELAYTREGEAYFEHVRFSPDGTFVVATGYGPKPVRSHDVKRMFAVSLATGKAIWDLEETVGDVAISPDSKSLFTVTPARDGAGWAAALVRRSAATGKEEARAVVPGADGQWWRRALLSVRPDGRVVDLRCADGGCIPVNAKSLKPAAAIDAPLHAGWYSADGKTAAAPNGRCMTLHDLATARPLPNSPPPLPIPKYLALRFSADGGTLTRTGSVAAAISWNTSTGAETARVPWATVNSEGVPGAPAFQTGSNVPVTRSGDGKKVLKFVHSTPDTPGFDLTVGGKTRRIHDLNPNTVMFYHLDFSPDGRFAMAACYGCYALLWDSKSDGKGKWLKYAEDRGDYGSDFGAFLPAPDSRRVAILESNPYSRQPKETDRWQVGVYELATRDRLAGVSGRGCLRAADWSAAANRFGGVGHAGAKGELTGFAFVATADGSFVMPPADLPKPATAAALSPDGRTLAVGSGGEVVLYEVRSRQVRHTFRPAGGEILTLRFHPNGGSLVSESEDGSLLMWDIRGELLALPEPDAAVAAPLGADFDSDDAVTAFRALRILAAHPERALPLLKAKVAEWKRPTAGHIAARVADLDAKGFAERDAAEKELRAMGAVAYPALKAALAANPTPELRARATKLLAVTVTPTAIRAGRLVEAVEWVGGAVAAELLTAWAASDWPELKAEAAVALKQRK